MENYNEQAEKNLLEMKKQKEEADKRLLAAEIWIAAFGTLFLLSLVLVAALVEMPVWAKIAIIVGGFIIFMIACLFALRIEQTAGYYECKRCRHKYVPTYKQVSLAMHIGMTRYMKCPHCGKKSWQKKVLSDEEK